MFAKMLNSKNELIEVEIQKAPKAIADLFCGHGFPVVYNNKLWLALYGREIDSIFLSHEISHSVVMSLACKEADGIYKDAIAEASEKASKIVSEIYDELQMLSPPWNA